MSSCALHLPQILVGLAAIAVYLALRKNERLRLNLSLAEVWQKANDMSPELVSSRCLCLKCLSLAPRLFVTQLGSYANACLRLLDCSSASIAFL